ncbi:hypothetical protein GIS00_08805 [Nakamurella sp. YIM 132087]|uniref:Uncharacterized protein n=1 Tax=Nakamurella alba TaxID=2665158 RepID=A0A7K1FIV3_9ACTN|nr:hypothetical protein [Nakamurella alba]MTD14042.1 hypothetical protein [Nakamurella alba]
MSAAGGDLATDNGFHEPAPQSVAARGGERRVWTHLFIEFALSGDERQLLDERLAAAGTNLPQIVVDALAAYVPLDTGAVEESTGAPEGGDFA